MYEKASPYVLQSWVSTLLVVAIPFMLIGGWLFWRLYPRLWLTFTLLSAAVVAVVMLWYLPRRRDSMRYCLGEHQVTVQGGVIFITTRRMDVDAVRHITLLQGPVERHYDTAFLLISATGGYLLIEGIDRHKAEAWCKERFPQ